VALPREIPQCTIRPDQATPQAERWHELARTAVAIDRSAQSLTLSFGSDVPVDTIERVIAVESECCPFFVMTYDANARVLSLSVDEREHAPALDAIADRLGA
jgi:hypothetical protein